MKETDALDEYILQHIDEEGDYLKALYRATHVKLLRPRMASGHLQGRMLKMFVRMIRPKQVLEIGTYSGYSALCLAEGLEEGGMVHTFEINDEQEDFTRPWLEGSPYADRIKFHIGDALELVENGVYAWTCIVTWRSWTVTNATTSTTTRCCCHGFLPVGISWLTIPCGTGMCWNRHNRQTVRPSVYRRSMT